MRTWREWTEHEDQVLWWNQFLPLAKQAELLGRTVKAVVERRNYLNLGAPRKVWTVAEMDYLRGATGTLQEQAERLGVARQEVRKKRWRMGLPAAPVNSEEN